MTEEEKEIIDNLTMKAITSSAEAPDYPNCIVMKKDLITLLNLIQKKDTEINKLKQENAELKHSITKATEIIDEYVDGTESDTKKLIEYQEKYINNK